MDATALRKLRVLVESPAVGAEFIEFAKSVGDFTYILSEGRPMTPSDAAVLHKSQLVRSLAKCLATTAWPSIVPAQFIHDSTHYEYRKVQYVSMMLRMICDKAEDTWGVPHMAVLLQQACDGGIVAAMSGAGAALPATIQSFAAEEAPPLHAFGLAVLEMFTTIFMSASYLSRGPGTASYGRHPAARAFWPAVRQQRSIEFLTQLAASCRGSSAFLWRGADSMRRILTDGLIRDGVGGFSEAALVCQRDAVRSSTVQTFMLETAAALCADAAAGNKPAEDAVQMLESACSVSFCGWIQFSIVNGYWSSLQLRDVFKPSGFTSCMDAFIAGKPEASPWHLSMVLTAVKEAVLALPEVSGSPGKLNWEAVDAVSRKATELRALGIVRQAAALLQLQRLPKEKQLSAARKAVSQGSLLGTPEQAVGEVPRRKPPFKPLTESLEDLVRQMDLFMQMHYIRYIDNEPSIVEPAEVLLAMEAVIRTRVMTPSIDIERQILFICEEVARAWKLAGSGAAPCSGAPGFIKSVRKALPANASPAPLLILLTLPMAVPIAHRATLEAAPTIFRQLAECSTRDVEKVKPQLAAILMAASQHQGCGPELAAAAAATIAPQSSGQRTVLRTVAAMAAQLVNGPAPDLETLRISHPVAGCFHPMCRNLSGVSEELLKTQLCGGCLRAAYCTPACQAAHWPAHKASCRVRRIALAAAEAQRDAAPAP